MTGFLVIAAGGFGSALRYAVGSWLQRRSASEVPVGTAAVNLSGSLLLGLAVGAGVSGDLLAAVTGCLAGFTTYSTWMVDTVGLAGAGRDGRLWALANLIGLMAIGLGLAAVGLAIGRAFG